jgi:hypothetical protein
VKVYLQAKCPTCGGVRDVLARGDGFVMAKHEARRTGFYGRRCDGGSPLASEVLAWAKSARRDKQREADASETKRADAHAALAKRLTEIDAEEMLKRAEVEAYDRAIKRIEKKVTT